MKNTFEIAETTVDFTIQRYIEKHKLTLARLYLTSKPDAYGDDSDLMHPALEPLVSAKSQITKQEKGKAWRLNHANPCEETGIQN